MNEIQQNDLILQELNTAINSDLQTLENPELDHQERLKLMKQVNIKIQDLEKEIKRFERSVGNVDSTVCTHYENYFESMIRYDLTILTNSKFVIIKREIALQGIFRILALLDNQHKIHNGFDKDPKHVQNRQNTLEQFLTKFKNDADQIISQNLAKLDSNELNPDERDKSIRYIEYLLLNYANNLDACNIKSDDPMRVTLTGHKDKLIAIMENDIDLGLASLENISDLNAKNQFITKIGNLLEQFGIALQQNPITSKSLDFRSKLFGNSLLLNLHRTSHNIAQDLARLEAISNQRQIWKSYQLIDHIDHISELLQVYAENLHTCGITSDAPMSVTLTGYKNRLMAIIQDCINQGLEELRSPRSYAYSKNQLITHIFNFFQKLTSASNQDPTPEKAQLLNELQSNFKNAICDCITQNMESLESMVLSLGEKNRLTINQYFDDTKNLLQHANTLVRNDQRLQQNDNLRFDQLRHKFRVTQTIYPALSNIGDILKLLDNYRRNSLKLEPDVKQEVRNFITRNLRSVFSYFEVDKSQLVKIGEDIACFHPDILEIFADENTVNRLEQFTETEQRNWIIFYSAIVGPIYGSGNKLPDKFPGHHMLQTAKKEYSISGKKKYLQTIIDRLEIAHLKHGDPNSPFIVKNVIANMVSSDKLAILRTALPYMQQHKNKFGYFGQRAVSCLETECQTLRAQLERENPESRIPAALEQEL